MTDRISFIVTTVSRVSWSRDDVATDAEWDELLDRVSSYTPEQVIDVLILTYDSTTDLIESSDVKVRRETE